MRSVQTFLLKPIYAALLVHSSIYMSNTAIAAGRVDFVEISIPKTSEFFSVNLVSSAINDFGQVSGNVSYVRNNASFSQFRRGFVFNNTITQYEPLVPSGFVGSTAANGINNAGFATGFSDTSSGMRFVTFKEGVTNNLGSGEGLAINQSGWIAGWSNLQAFVFNGTSTLSLGNLLGASRANDINDHGQVVGRGTFNGAQRAFLYSNGNVLDLGTLGGASSTATAINNRGVIVGSSLNSSGANRAFIYENGVMRDLGTLGGNSSIANNLNDSGQIVGSSDNSAFLYTGFQNSALINLNLIAPSGWTLTSAQDINRYGQILVNGSHQNQSKSLVITLHPEWQGTSGNWDDATKWNFGGLGALNNLTPGLPHDVIISGNNTSLTVNGSQNAEIKSLLVSGAQGQVTTLDLQNGRISTKNGATFNANSQLTGNGNLDGNIVLNSGSQVRVSSGQSMLLSGGLVSNNGAVRVLGSNANAANLTVAQAFQNQASGQINLQNANVELLNTLVNNGLITVSAGNSNLFGNVINTSNGRLFLSGNSNTTFYDTVEISSGGELRVSAGSTATFFGEMIQRTGAIMSGNGTKFYEGGLSVGNSPGLGVDAGNVSFGASNQYLAEIGGTFIGDSNGNGLQFDRYIVNGTLTLGGTLKLVSWNSFIAESGQSFDLFDWGNLIGQFDVIDTSGLSIASGAQLDLSRLYVDGTISVTPVPEPSGYAFMLAGLGLIAYASRKRKPI
ncbi:HAF repeat-containing PEP-CTERM protein [Methylophilus methylotrophus]|uniref:HAF repeat-containing PEP-CTERM protein n=1 Tax=Methylophilus methylotrophus TaxID=17 RepID=UPI00035E6A32|nr:HAF repeat-containing PEP-CTERM protein [Methylophilus methylotrophus]